MTNQKALASRKMVRRITVTGILTAIIALLVFTPLGMIPITPAISATTAHLPVLVGLLAEGPIVGLILGAVLGVLSLVRAVVSPATLLDPFFQNPLISVMPRLLIPVVAYGAYRLMLKLAGGEGRGSRIAAYTFSGLIGSLWNTLSVLTMLSVIYGSQIVNMIATHFPDHMARTVFNFLFVMVALPNGVPEAVVTAIVMPAIMMAITPILKRA